MPEGTKERHINNTCLETSGLGAADDTGETGFARVLDRALARRPFLGGAVSLIGAAAWLKVFPTLSKAGKFEETDAEPQEPETAAR